MALAAATLADALDVYAPTLDAAVAAQNFAAAYATYMSEADGIVGDALSASESAMASAMAFDASTANGSAQLQAGLVAFWSGMVSAVATLFPGHTVLTPAPGIASVSASLAPVLVTNTDNAISKASALSNLANAIHTASQGGTKAAPPAAATAIA